MEIREFLELSEGKWFSQRTTYHLTQEQGESTKAELSIERLLADSPEVVKLCQQYQIDPSLAWGGTKISWDNSVDWGKPKQIGSSLLVFLRDRENNQIGQFLRSGGELKSIGRYIIGNDRALTLIVEDESTYAEERQWFASPNLRLRTTIVKNTDGFTQTSFYSEIRRMLPKTEQETKDVATQA